MNRTGTYGTIQAAAIFDIISILTGNIASMVFGVMTLFFLNNEEVKNEMRQRGIY